MPAPSFPAARCSGWRTQGLDKASLSVVWKSSLLRYGPHTLRSGLDAELRAALVTFLTGLRESHPDAYDLLEPHRGGGFAEVSAGDYATALDMVRVAPPCESAETVDRRL